MAKITIDELSVELKNLLAGTVGDGAELSSLGKKIIAEHFGTPLEPTHTFEEICDVIDNIIDEFKLNLASKGVIPNPDDKIKELVGKVLDIGGKERVYLYNDGDECEDITGGWNSSWNKTDWTNRHMFSKESDKMLFNLTTSSTSTIASICPTNKINLTNYSKLFIEFNLLELDSSTDSRDFLICFIDGLTDLTYSQYVTMSDFVGAGKVTASFDISDVNGDKYVVPNIKQWASGKKMNVEIYKLWLEKEPEKINKDNMIELLNNEGIEVDSSETANELLYKLENDLIEAQKQELRNILISKGMEITESEITLSNLIQKVNEVQVSSIEYLYKDGFEFTNLSGGFTSGCTITGFSAGTLTKGSTSMTINNSNNINKLLYVNTVNLIDLTPYKTIKMKCKNTSVVNPSAATPSIELTEDSNFSNTSIVKSVYGNKASTDVQTLILNVADINKPMCLRFRSVGNTLVIYEICLEV